MNKISNAQKQLLEHIKKLELDRAKLHVIYKKNSAHIKKLEYKLREAARKAQRQELKEKMLQEELKKRNFNPWDT